MRPLILQLFSPMPALQERLDARYRTQKFAAGEVDPDWLRENAVDVRGVVTAGDIGVSNDLANQLPNLGVIAINGVGHDRVDLDYARARNIHVTITPDVLTDDVADVAIGLMLNCYRKLAAADAYLRRGEWLRKSYPLTRKASGRRYGIVGLGRIGQAIATRLQGFGGTIAYANRTARPVAYQYYPDVTALAAASDVLFVTIAANTATKGLISAAVLSSLGPDGIIVNVARGSVIDEDALLAALAEGRIAGAGLDVFVDEPNVPAGLLRLDNVALTPHVGSGTVETRMAMGNLLIDNLDAFFSGKALPSAVV